LRALWPDQIASYWDHFWLLFARSRDAEAVALLGDRQAGPAGERDEHTILAQALNARLSGSAGQREAAARALVTLAQAGTGYAGNSIVVLSRLGRFDEAVTVARALYLQKGPIRIDRSVQFVASGRFPLHGEADTEVLFHPFVAPLRKSGRLDEVFQGIGLADLWRTAGGPDV
jgi:hypothetical protein